MDECPFIIDTEKIRIVKISDDAVIKDQFEVGARGNLSEE